MQFQLKTISRDGIDEAISKAELYRFLNEPEETESICHDVLAADPGNQPATRLLGLAITDQFSGQSSDRYAEVEKIFQDLSNPYERYYYTGILYERRAKAHMRAGFPRQILVSSFLEAMHCFEEAEKSRPPNNDDALLRWNRCVRLLETLPPTDGRPEEEFLEDHDSAPMEVLRRTGTKGAR
jgi:tetratricopeptide (TPR) repeat protein